MQSLTPRHQTVTMNEYHEIHEIEEVMLSYTKYHMTKKEDERTGMRQVEDNGVNHTS